MISWNDFENAVVTQLGRDITEESNPDQNRAIGAPQGESLFIVAGPGSGKTTVIAVRVLKLIFVDEIDPSGILVTTFTRKAAAELRSRMLGWGDQLRRSFVSNPSYEHVRYRLRKLDLNRIVTGTLDSIAEETLGSHRAPGTPPPVVIEDFVSNALMTRDGLIRRGRFRDQFLREYVANLKGTAWRINVAELSATLLSIKDRLYHDQMDFQLYRSSSVHPGGRIACDAIGDYVDELENRLLFDFARLEAAFLTHLRNGTLSGFLDEVQFLLVDEYQDTNLLQEQIYLEIARAALGNGGSVAVVGDDDQSLYRFRGATVDLFGSFEERIHDQLALDPTVVYLSRNYRSTQAIVDFCNAFVTLDQQFQSARVQYKPAIEAKRSQGYANYPILGMFRSGVEDLANDLAQFIHAVIHSGGVQAHDHQGNRYTIRIDPEHGSPADIALLVHSPRELDGQRRARLPLLLRNELERLSPSIQVFNPRGQDLQTMADVQVLCGLILECVDPHGIVQDRLNVTRDAVHMLGSWRAQASAYISTNPAPTARTSLDQFVAAWQNRTALGRRTWDRETPLIDLVYKLVTWIPGMQSDIESLVYLEAILRTVNQAGWFGDFGGHIIFDRTNPRVGQASIREAFWNIFLPIAAGSIEVNEDLFETLPSDRINIMSIHQAKGLEFPLVIVDVGSDYRTNHYGHSFRRFPRDGGMTCNMEDELRFYSPLGPPQTAALDRAFDDLTRLYFEAYSRAQDVLLLVGLDSVRQRIPNVATGWDRNGTWHWGEGLNNLVHI